MHKRILDMLICRYDRPIMNNIQRGDYLECMIASTLGASWRLTTEDGWDWAAWDCEHVSSGARLEIKQSAAKQSWDRESDRPRRNPAFDIAPRKGYWPKDGGRWVQAPGRRLCRWWPAPRYAAIDKGSTSEDVYSGFLRAAEYLEGTLRNCDYPLTPATVVEGDILELESDPISLDTELA